MTRLRFGVLVGLLTIAVGCRQKHDVERVADPSSKRTTTFGDVVGFSAASGTQAWLGIPFAASPVEKLRWRAPVPPASWNGVRQALGFGPPCVQYASVFGGVSDVRPGTPVGSEDCLYLNIWAPASNPDQSPKGAARLPVMFWIHGGGNTIGEAAFYDGANLAGSQKVIVVTTQYRLGPFGWFRNAALNDPTTTDDDHSGNFGTLDLIRSLDWVRKNIANFGGDPDNVTIFGESAGGTNVYSLLLSPKAHGLFQRAIVESGGFFFSPPQRAEDFADDGASGDPNSSNELLLRLIQRDGVAKDRDGAKVHLSYIQPKDVARYLRSKAPYDLLAGYEAQPNVGMIRMPLVFSDGTVLPTGDPIELLHRSGGYNQVPVLLGTNRDENKLFMFPNPQYVRKMLWIFPRLRNPKEYDLTAEYLAKNWKAMGVDEPAAAMRSVQGASVFAYRFDWDEEPTLVGSNLAEMLGASHGFEIPFVFGHFDLGKEGNRIFTQENEAGRLGLSKSMMSYWAEFAYHGAPGRGRDGNQPEWTAWDSSAPAAPKFMVLDTAGDGGLRMSSEAVTRASLLESLEKDPRFESHRQKCKVLHDLVNWSRGVSKAEYDKMCPGVPFETVSWDG